MEVGGRPLIAHTLLAIAGAAVFDTVVVVAPEARHEAIRAIAEAAGLRGVICVTGGHRRRESVAAGLAAVGDVEIVAIHDAARPLVASGLFGTVIGAARLHGAATVAVPCVDTIKRVEANMVVETLPRSAVVAAQTPQAFAAGLLRRAHVSAGDTEDASDDCLMVERLGAPVAVVPGDVHNRKVTHVEDLEWLRARLEGS
jgi:2-C-methyl-D-erythritol 4-phosphate cytidylyltransferase